jgi:hypothetical protein
MLAEYLPDRSVDVRRRISSVVATHYGLAAHEAVVNR